MARKTDVPLKQCPFCGDIEDVVMAVVGSGDKKYAVVCNTCGARGGRREDEFLARVSWNKRRVSEFW